MQLEEIFFWSYVYFVLEIAIIALWGLGAIYSLKKITKYRNMFLGFLGCSGMFLLRLGDNLLAIPQTLFFTYEDFEKILLAKFFLLSLWEYMDLYYQREGLTILFQICLVFALSGRFVIKEEKSQEQEQEPKQKKLVEVIIETDEESEITSFDVSSRDLDDLDREEDSEYTEGMESQESDVSTYSVSHSEHTEDMESDVTNYDAVSHELGAEEESDTFYDAASHEIDGPVSDDDYSDEYMDDDMEAADEEYEENTEEDTEEDTEDTSDYEEASEDEATFCDVPSEDVAPEMVEDDGFDAVSAQMEAEAVPEEDSNSNVEHFRSLKPQKEEPEQRSLLGHVTSKKKPKKIKGKFDGK